MDNNINGNIEPFLTRTSGAVAAALATDPKLERIVAQMGVGVRWAEPGEDKPWQIVATGSLFHLCYWEVPHVGWSHVDFYIQSIDWEEEKSED